MKKLLGLMLGLTMATVAVAGCNNATEENEAPKSQETYDVDFENGILFDGKIETTLDDGVGIIDSWYGDITVLENDYSELKSSTSLLFTNINLLGMKEHADWDGSNELDLGFARYETTDGYQFIPLPKEEIHCRNGGTWSKDTYSNVMDKIRTNNSYSKLAIGYIYDSVVYFNPKSDVVLHYTDIYLKLEGDEGVWLCDQSN